MYYACIHVYFFCIYYFLLNDDTIELYVNIRRTLGVLGGRDHGRCIHFYFVVLLKNFSCLFVEYLEKMRVTNARRPYIFSQRGHRRFSHYFS